MKRSEPHSVGSLLDLYMTRAGARERLGMEDASLLWPSLVGENVAALTQRRWIKGTELHVAVDSAPLRQDLSMSRGRLLRELNEALGRDLVTALVFY